MGFNRLKIVQKNENIQNDPIFTKHKDRLLLLLCQKKDTTEAAAGCSQAGVGHIFYCMLQIYTIAATGLKR